MATLKTILRLQRLGLYSVPAVVTATQCGEINATTRKLFQKDLESNPEGYCYNVVELIRAGWWYVRQPFAGAQLQRFLDTEGNLAEEYLESGKFSVTQVDLGSRLAALRGDPPTRQVREDKYGGKVVLINEPLEVKEHRRVHKQHREQFAVCILAAVKMKFGVPKRTAANQMAMHRYAGELMKHKGVRPTDAARIIPYVVAAAFIPSDDELNAAQWLSSSVAIDRMKGWTNMPTA